MAAFSQADQIVTDYPSGCGRHILISAHGIRNPDIPEAYKIVGELNEVRWQEELTGDTSVTEVLREEPVKGDVYGSEEIKYSGRADFIVTYEDGHEEVHECKATVSKTSRREVLRKGNVKLNHLAQLLSYMIQLELQDGKLVYGYYQYPWSENHDSTELVCTEDRVFKVRIEDDGRVTVDGLPTAYTVLDQLHHMQRVVKILTDKEIADRPALVSTWSSPCRWCPFNQICNEIDATGMDLKTLLLKAEKALEKEQQREPNIFRPKRKPKESG